MAAISEICSYRSFSGQVFDATVTVVHPDGRVDLDIWLPDAHLGLQRTKIEYIDNTELHPKGTAFPKPAVGETAT